MTPEQYKFFTKEITPIEGYHLDDQSDRTLLYGYTLERDTFHVYLKDGVIHKFVFKNNYGDGPNIVLIHEEGAHNPYSLVPSKRAYPDRCDFEFCKLLHEGGISTPFTVFDYERFSTSNVGKSFGSDIFEGPIFEG